ncbi:hypothetical protein T484DRAFT_2606749 [Baffinella frigidus]|nr:hypothetical protein T484DRAFT_2606749 [Cryptophyta sp. CCMP2293]
MEWLQKAGDLLDKLDKTAAEKLNANDEDAEDEEALLRLLESSDAADILNESPGEGESKGEGEEGKKEAKDGKALSPRSSLRADISRLETSLRKKSSQVEQLVTSHKSLMNATAERERKANAETAKLRTQVDEAQKGQRAAEAKRTEAEKQLEAMRKHLESQSGEGEQLRAEAATARSEASSAQAQSAGLKLELEEEQQAHAELLARHATMMEQLTSARAEHRTELGSLQDREESLSSEKLYFTRELAAVERKRQESETSAREAESLLRQAEERTKEAEGALQTAEEETSNLGRKIGLLEEAANLGRKIGLLEMAGGKLEERIQGVRDEAEAETKVVRRELEAAQMTVRQLQREQRQALSRGGEQELQMQLSKMCEEVLAKQALLEQVSLCNPSSLRLYN